MTDRDQMRASFEELERRAAENRDEALRGKVRAVVATWRHNRELYPGWVVAPWTNRFSLFQSTAGWVEAIASAAADVSATESVQWLRELTWRLDTCLLPLEQPIVEAAEAALVTCAYFESSDDCQQSFDREVAEDCIALSASLLRMHREAADVGAFERHEARLRVSAKTIPELRSHLAYERILLHLGRLEWSKAARVLAAWQPPFGGPAWDIRRAAVAIEMGDLEGQRLVREALSTVQDALPRGPVSEASDFHLLSCEGWAITNIAQTSMFSSKLADANRLEELAAVHCDPFVTLERMRSILGKKRLAHSRRFLGDEPTDLQYAMQATRLIEVGGQIVRLGNQIVGAPLLEAAGKWIVEVAPMRAISIFLRIGNANELVKALTPRVISRLSDEQIASTVLILRAALNEGIVLVAGARRSSEYGSPLDVQDERSRDQVETALAGICALCPRISSDTLHELVRDLSRFRRAWTSGVWQVRMNLEESSNALLRSMTSQDRSEHALELLDQPLAGTIVGMPGVLGWPNDPFGLLLSSPPISRAASEERWRRVVGDLIHTTFITDNRTTRANGLLRCAVLHRLSAFEPSELERLNQAVWSPGGLGERFELPCRFLLSLPQAADGQAERLVRRYVAALDLPRFALDFEGLERKWRMQNLNDYDVLFNVLALTRTPLDGLETDRLGAIEWRTEEVAALLTKIEAWWDEEGREFYAFVTRDSLWPNGTGRRFTSIVETIAYVGLGHSSVAHSSGRLLRKLADAGIETALACPVFVAEEPSKAEEFAQTLRRKIASSGSSEVVAAFLGAYIWFDDDGRALPPIPFDLPREISAVIFGRRQPGLAIALSLAVRLISQHSVKLTANFFEDLRVGLHHLRLETDFHFDNDEDHHRILANERSLAIDLVVAIAQIADAQDTMVAAWFADADREPFRVNRSKLLTARALWTQQTGGSAATA